MEYFLINSIVLYISYKVEFFDSLFYVMPPNK